MRPHSRTSLDREAWDGDWYRRGWFDDGTALGSSSSDECQIDSIAQSWAVLSGAAAPDRAIQAMAAVKRELVLPQARVALLFKPPFDKTHREPGYIKGYPAGIRENGGQYTHAAVWSVMALAKLGRRRRREQPVLDAQSDQSRTDAGRCPDLQGRAVRHRRRHLCDAASRRARRLDLVHRFGRTDAAGRHRKHTGIACPGQVRFALRPAFPATWPGFEIDFRNGSATYEIRVENPDRREGGVRLAELDGKAIDLSPLVIPLVDDGTTHRLRLVI